MHSKSRFLPVALAIGSLLPLACGKRPGPLPEAGPARASNSPALSADLPLHWSSVESRPAMKAGEKTTVKVTVHNDGGAAISPELLAFSYHWRDSADPRKIIVWDGARTVVKGAIAPATDYAADVVVKAPDKPGRYLLEMDLVREGVAWTSGRGIAAPRQEVTVS